MASTQPRIHLVASVIDHCLAFADHLEPLKDRQYATVFPENLLLILEELNSAIKERLEALKTDLDFNSLGNEEAEQHVLRYSKLYSYLYFVASFIERSDVPHTIVELVQPLKRLMALQCSLNNFELLLHPLPVLNYSFYNLGNGLSEVKDQLDIAGANINVPNHLIAVGFPGLEMGRILAHSIVAHELGHWLYTECKLEDKLLPLVNPDANSIEKLVSDLAESKVNLGTETSVASKGQRTLSEYLTEVEIKSHITRLITDLSKLWVKELTCDAIGYCFLGPAYLFAAIDILTLAYEFDDDQGTHPTNRMRFILLYKMLDNESDFNIILPSKVKVFLQSWKSLTQSAIPQFSDPIRKLTGGAVLKIYGDIIASAISAVGNAIYSASKNDDELRELIKRAKEFVPPNEIIKDGVGILVQFQSILNAGWIVYLAGLDKLQKKFSLDSWECKTKFNELIARSVEYNEIQRRWKEIQ